MQSVLTAEQEMLRTATRQFLAKTAPVDQMRENVPSEHGFDLAWWARGAELGWTGLLAAPEFGGGSMTDAKLVDLALVALELGRVVAPGPLAATNVVAGTLSDAANAENHRDLIEGLVAGSNVASWAVYEPGRAWGPSAIAMRAERVEGRFRLTGVKDRVESGDQADHFLVTARTDDGLAQFVVAANHPGVRIAPDYSLDPVRRFATVAFEDVQVDEEARVEAATSVDADVERQLTVAVVLQCAETLGVLDRVFEMTLQWAFDRFSFGRPLASYQAIKHRFADLKANLEACHATTFEAAQAVSQGGEQSAELASIAKSWVGQHATDIVQDCVQLHGGIALTTEHDLHLYLRRATVNRVMWGTPSDHRRRIADILCGPTAASEA